MKKLLVLMLVLLTSGIVYAETYSVERVIDGDTIVVTTSEGKSEEVDLIGIDCPESQPNDKAKRDSKRTGKDLETINKMGQEATYFMSRQVMWKGAGRKLRLEFDVQERDKYGRLLAYIYILYGEKEFLRPSGDKDYDKRIEIFNDDGSKDMFLNAYLVKWGYATPMTIPPNVKYAELFRDLYKEALNNDRGLWGLNKSWCEDNGGKYLRSINGCHMTATDEGKVCKDSSECEGACYVSPSADNVKKFKAGLISGECTGTATIRFGPDRPVSVEEGMKALQRM